MLTGEPGNIINNKEYFLFDKILEKIRTVFYNTKFSKKNYQIYKNPGTESSSFENQIAI